MSPRLTRRKKLKTTKKRSLKNIREKLSNRFNNEKLIEKAEKLITLEDIADIELDQELSSTLEEGFDRDIAELFVMNRQNIMNLIEKGEDKRVVEYIKYMHFISFGWDDRRPETFKKRDMLDFWKDY